MVINYFKVKVDVQKGDLKFRESFDDRRVIFI